MHTLSCNSVIINKYLRHDWLDHPHYVVVKYIASNMNSNIDNVSTLYLCNLCQLTKSHRLPVTHVHTRSL